MPGYLYDTNVTALCPHGGQISGVASSPRVKLGSQPALTVSDSYPIAGCAFNISGSPHPCVKVQWLAPATRIRIGNRAAILQNSSGLCVAGDQAPQGSPVITPGQTRVKGS